MLARWFSFGVFEVHSSKKWVERLDGIVYEDGNKIGNLQNFGGLIVVRLYIKNQAVAWFLFAIIHKN